MLQQLLKVNPYFVKDYEVSASNIMYQKQYQVISLLRTYDMRSKGFGDAGTEPAICSRNCFTRYFISDISAAINVNLINMKIST